MPRTPGDCWDGAGSDPVNPVREPVEPSTVEKVQPSVLNRMQQERERQRQTDSAGRMGAGNDRGVLDRLCEYACTFAYMCSYLLVRQVSFSRKIQVTVLVATRPLAPTGMSGM